MLYVGTSSCLAQVENVQVLNWWASDSERKATKVIAAKLKDANIAWRDDVIPSGSGIGASIVLRSRMLVNDPPYVAQVSSNVIREWAPLGLLLDLDKVAEDGKWDARLLPAISSLITPAGHVMAAPLGIHRFNMLFFNRRLFNKFDLAPPLTWSDFERAAVKLQNAGIVVLAQSSEPWQISILFEVLVLAEGGAAFHNELFIKGNASAFSDPRMSAALTHLRALKKWMSKPVLEQAWPEETRQLADGKAAMMIMGDWAKGELNAWGLVTDDAFGCTPVPGTEKYHLFNVDTLVMLSTLKSHRKQQEKLADVVMSPAIQSQYNQIKGSIPVLKNPPLAAMDSCARASWNLFSNDSAAQVPSMLISMDESVGRAVIAEVHRFFIDDQISVADTQQRLGNVSRALTKNKLKIDR
jgi:glucose/mannose transport system substrate-binding protein